MNKSTLAATAMVVLTLSTTVWASCWAGTPPNITIGGGGCKTGFFGGLYCDPDTGSSGTQCYTSTYGAIGCDNTTPTLNDWTPYTKTDGTCGCKKGNPNGTVTGGLPHGDICKPG